MELGHHYDGMPRKNPYDALEISRTATEADVKSAYRRLARQSHPDRRPAELDDARRAELDEQWDDISVAHSFLSEADSTAERTKFDAHLAAAEASQRVFELAAERVRREGEERAKQTEDESSNDEGGGGTGRDAEAKSQRHAASSDENNRNSPAGVPAGQRTDEKLAQHTAEKLASRAYHLPGCDWRRDWIQYVLGNHPLFGVCCHHPLHPATLGSRLFLLLVSLFYGLAVTSAVSLWLPMTTSTGDEEEVFAVPLPLPSSNPNNFAVTTGMLVLLTAGSGSHALFDHCSYALFDHCAGSLEARGCCRSTRVGYCLCIVLAVAMAAFLSCVLVIGILGGEVTGCGDLCGPLEEASGELFAFFESFDDDRVGAFLAAYALEFAVSSLAYGPAFETLLFSGILGCFRDVPVVGGRPYEARRESNARPDEASVCPSQDEHSDCPSHMA